VVATGPARRRDHVQAGVSQDSRCPGRWTLAFLRGGAGGDGTCLCDHGRPLLAAAEGFTVGQENAVGQGRTACVANRTPGTPHVGVVGPSQDGARSRVGVESNRKRVRLAGNISRRQRKHGSERVVARLIGPPGRVCPSRSHVGRRRIPGTALDGGRQPLLQRTASRVSFHGGRAHRRISWQ